ncbi:conserved hypothetical protein [Ferroglobus placidus DSM 10642]|uniref:Tubulin-like CetZ C-terminal domain-containing protein n=1 Tax=Ferroglobus placidus (strain DSM 10642 / AEDII12DO) TaxID=589924 RepID=D3S2A9_FERPA|nr:hypothetical protein [Ferroglobus placidus]ADC66600.1 conserved hypothetical protein [Ferroglobus placidus DSM 10642]
MKLLTIGAGKAANIVDVFAKRGAEVNKAKLFKCYTVSNELEELKKLRSVPQENRFYAVWKEDLPDLRSVINSIMSRYEIYEASLVVTDLTDDFSFFSSISLFDELERSMEEPKLCLALIPDLSNPEKIEKVRRGLRTLMKTYDFLFVFEKRNNYEDLIVDSFNTLSLVGEIDARKKTSGEVVVDTSDFLNSLDREGFTILGYSKRKISLFSRIFKSDAELRGERTKRMVDLLEESLSNLSARGDIDSAKKALIVFSGNPEEISMEGLFTCIKRVEKISGEMLVRYGDYPIPRSNFVSSVVLFSGIKKFTL